MMINYSMSFSQNKGRNQDLNLGLPKPKPNPSVPELGHRGYKNSCEIGCIVWNYLVYYWGCQKLKPYALCGVFRASTKVT